MKDTKDNVETKEPKSIKTVIKELIPYVIIVVVVVLIRTYLVTPIIVSGESMKPTLDGGELMILNKLGKVDRFDIVVVKFEKNNKKDELIKRVIAMPGETISCENGIVYVNGKKQEEPYSKGLTEDFDKVELADDEYFVMGDNRANSADSRLFGPFKEKDLKGTTGLVLFPFSKIGKVK